MNGAAMAAMGANGGAAGAGSAVQYGTRSASLYVGDLAPSTTESQLFEAFSQVSGVTLADGGASYSRREASGDAMTTG